MQHEHRLDVYRAAVTEPSRRDRADRRRVVLGEVVEALNRGKGIETKRASIALLQQRDLTHELSGAIARPEQRQLRARPESIADLQADDGAAVEAEEIRG